MVDALPGWVESLRLPGAAVAGAALGVAFFGGLWWTVAHAASFQRPGRAVFMSLMLRMGIALAVFWLVGGGRWQRLLLCLLGFIAARAAVTWWARTKAASSARHAP